ncbi:sensor histidine kinase [Magnetofaba australis]|uniref:histidine kinase n=1 Tax=Magnetofaba australis IT-1 TaxID=1434232 RepID=A0A1Y2K064_9PROT|nr:ATP-binding protein [Magnetofaba australis]OSM01352.1 putative sensor signal transduction histidine kinase [Magnetofaba australis IT-1]
MPSENAQYNAASLNRQLWRNSVVLGVLACALALGVYVVVTQHGQTLEKEQTRLAQAVYHLLSVSIRDALERGDYEEITPFVKEWGKSHPQATEILLTSSNGSVLAEYHAQGKGANEQLTLAQEIAYSYRGRARLSMSHDMAIVARSKSDLALKLGGIALFMWLSLILAVRQSLRRRREALAMSANAASLDEANRQLQWEASERRKAELDLKLAHHYQSAINRYLRSALEPVNLAQRLELALELLHVHPGLQRPVRAGLFLLEPGGEYFSLAASLGLSDAQRQRWVRLHGAESAFWRAIGRRKPTLLGPGDGEMGPDPQPEEYGAVAIPILHGPRLLGVVFSQRGPMWRDEDQEGMGFLEALGGALAGFIEINRADEEAQRHRLAAERLNRDLERRVRDAVMENRRKDALVMKQSRLAAMGEMIGNIAHQWRQPLNALALTLTNIQDAYEYGQLDDAFLNTQMEKSRRLIRQMSTTIDDFRNFMRPDRRRTRYDLTRIVQEAMELVAATFSSASIDLRLDGPSLPVWTEGYPNEMVQVLMVLLTNAKDAILDSGLNDGRVWIQLEDSPDGAAIQVCDNGGGIDEAVIDQIFEPYFTTKSEQKGTGIGLYMAKMIIDEKMGGALTANNADEGACFTLRLPPVTPLEDDVSEPIDPRSYPREP